MQSYRSTPILIKAKKSWENWHAGNSLHNMRNPTSPKPAALIPSLVVASIAALFFSACQKPKTQTTKPTAEFDASYIEAGREIVMSKCAECHATDRTGISPRSDAPPLRTVLSNYNPSALADDFREHIHVGHPDMPDFDFTVLQTEGVLAYLTSIQVTPH